MTNQLKLPGLILPSVGEETPDRSDLRDWPDVSAATVCRFAKQLGAAGEALFDCQMLCFGELSLAVGEFFPFDRLIARANGLIRVQVKSVTMPSDHGYTVEPRKGYRGSPRGLQRYGDDEFDLLAIVILRESVVYYTADNARTHHIPFSAIAHLRRRPRASFDAAIAALGAGAEVPQAGPSLPGPA